MATKTVTVDTNEWKYVDKFGIEHTVTNAQTFTFTLTDGGAAAVTYNFIPGQNVTTTDGYTIEFAPLVTASNSALQSEVFADTEDATEVHKNFEMRIKCPVSGDVQIWKVAKITLDNVDAPTVITSATFEDQFGNKMEIPDDGVGITVA